MRLIWSASCGKFLSVVRKQRFPLLLKFGATFANTVAEVFQHAIRNQELRIFGPAVEFLYQPNFFVSQRFAVSGAGVLLVR